MISRITLKKEYDIEGEGRIAIRTPLKNICTKKIKIYIPYLMSDIKEKHATKSILHSRGRSVFINDAKCKPRLSVKVLKEQNYVLADPEMGEDISDMKKEYTSPSGEKYEAIPRKTPVHVFFKNHKLSNVKYSHKE